MGRIKHRRNKSVGVVAIRVGIGAVGTYLCVERNILADTIAKIYRFVSLIRIGRNRWHDLLFLDKFHMDRDVACDREIFARSDRKEVGGIDIDICYRPILGGFGSECRIFTVDEWAGR